eukprot:TRINITY_DN24001_c0_g1_i1.p1 TRINITY_DN24001_c0_g1~~TRINITY_DN24001_c0_g1_i1.p1  ORF type:complete len:336 (+),score=69.39 TRINITY_DN24001_c0_g1_i1:134-1141(+)
MASQSWPPGFALALGAFRQALRFVPPGLVRSAPLTQGLLQPLANTVGWPPLALPRGVTVAQDELGGVPGEWFLPEAQREPLRSPLLLLWAHGGGFLFCSSRTHRLFLAKVAKRAGVPVFCVNYRKPPAHPLPAPAKDVEEAFRAVRARANAEHIFLGGDSAGGNLALVAARSLLLDSSGSATMRPAEVKACKPPRGVVLMSPWVDLTDFGAGPCGGASWREFADVDYIPARLASEVAALYVAAGASAADAVEASPGLCEDWGPAFPPVLLDFGGCEVFRSQIEALARRLAAGGVDLDVCVADGMVHGYPFFDFLWNAEGGPFETYYRRVSRFLQR